MSDLITVSTDPPVDTLLNELTRQAEALAIAEVQNAHLQAAGSPLPWRNASLVWPLFTRSLMKKG